MANSPFREIPSLEFLLKIAGPAAVAGILGFMFMGVAANSGFIDTPKSPAAVPSFFEASLDVYRSTFEMIGNRPPGCILGDTVSDFQRSQCSKFWSSLTQTGVLALVPPVLALLFILLNFGAFKGLYESMTKSVEKSKASFGGKVTTPAEAPGDLFSWYYCLQPVAVQLSNQAQITVYMSSTHPIPLPGETLAVYDGGEHFGQKRYFAVVYAPHIAVVKGA